MQLGFRSRVRHPLYPGLGAIPAVEATGECAVLCGSFEELEKAAAAGARPLRAVYALNSPNDPFLSDFQRDALWEKFEVPVFVLVVDARKRVLAFECEAQEGLHVATDLELNVPALWDFSPCECGRPGHRILPVQRKPAASAAELSREGAGSVAVVR